MKILRKITILFLISIFASVFLCSCANINPLYDKVSELRSDLFLGEGEHFSLSACYGFKETPFLNDTLVNEKIYYLSFKLKGQPTDNSTKKISMEHDKKLYQAEFKLNPVTHTVVATFEVEGFNLKEFSVTISADSLTEKITLRSILPENTLDYKSALDFLYKDQPTLIEKYSDSNGNFNAEIYARVIVKENAPYWYIGIATGNDNLKALLIDGFTGELLAIREIF